MRANRTKIPYFLALMCCLLNVSVFAGVQGQPAAFEVCPLPLTECGNTIGAFVVADSGRLYRVVLDLNSQNAVWEDLGGTQLRPSVAVLDLVNPQFVFVIGGDGNLYAKYWDGNAWQWSYHGNPGVTLSGNMSAVSYIPNLNDGRPNYAVFVVGDDNSLYVNWRNGNDGQWQWSALGGTALTHYVSAMTYYNGNLHINVYVVGGDGNLYRKFWDGNAWQWGFVGRPDVNVSVTFPSALYRRTSADDQVFVVGSNGHQYSWDAADGWLDLGGSQLVNPPAAAQWSEYYSAPVAFIVGGNGTLYQHTAGGAPWTSPGGCGLRPFVSPALGGIDYWIFVIGGNGRFYAIEDINTDTCWNWYGYDLSAYPGAP